MKDKILHADIYKEEDFDRFADHETISHREDFEDVDDFNQNRKRHIQIIDIERDICLNNKFENKTSDIANLIRVAKEEVLYNLMFSNFIFHYILFQTTYTKIFQFQDFES
jgi:hypothetical protein